MLVQKLLLQNLSLQNLCPSEAMKVRICVESLVTIRSCLLQRLFASEAAELELQIQHSSLIQAAKTHSSHFPSEHQKLSDFWFVVNL
ncbi:hypothetical protein QL285_028102 [Trifolium repens]|nr:hypothetical protein QL285_028102 [Trifolium repens]